MTNIKMQLDELKRALKNKKRLEKVANIINGKHYQSIPLDEFIESQISIISNFKTSRTNKNFRQHYISKRHAETPPSVHISNDLIDKLFIKFLIFFKNIIRNLKHTFLKAKKAAYTNFINCFHKEW